MVQTYFLAVVSSISSCGSAGNLHTLVQWQRQTNNTKKNDGGYNGWNVANEHEIRYNNEVCAYAFAKDINSKPGNTRIVQDLIFKRTQIFPISDCSWKLMNFCSVPLSCSQSAIRYSVRQY